MNTIITLVVIIVIAVGLVWVYFHYMMSKRDKFMLIEKGLCPECKQPTIEIVDKKSGGCCGPSMVTYECSNCGYKDVFSIERGSCGM